jgi:hypothetical protein
MLLSSELTPKSDFYAEVFKQQILMARVTMQSEDTKPENPWRTVFRFFSKLILMGGFNDDFDGINL